jgi:conjugal transfer pilus assembly protein TraB
MALNNKKIELETIGEKAKKKKDFLIVVSIVSIFTFLIISIGLTFMNVDKKKVFKKRQEKVINKKEVALIPDKDFKENWAISVENTLEKQNKVLTEFMRKTTEDLNKTRSELKDMIADSIAQQREMIQKNNEDTNAKIDNLKSYLNDSLEKQENRIEEISIMKGTGGVNLGSGSENEEIELGDDLLPPLPKIEKSSKETVKKTEESIEDIIGANTGTENNNNIDKNTTMKNEPSETKKPHIRAMKISLIDIDTESNQQLIEEQEAELAKLEKQEKKNHSYHVMIGLSRAFMVTGAYAPAFSAGDEEPLPVLLQAEGDILIANDDTESVDRCFLIGSAKGNMNSKTADIRLVKISCSLNEGKQMIEGGISGWVIGENGIPGVPGELLHKNGAWLAQTFVAGFMQTFSDALANTGTTQISFGGTTNGGNTQVPLGNAVSDNAAAAVGGGLSSVFGQLGEYYLKMAEQIFPVIEVKAGRTVNILLKGGEDLEVKDFNKLSIGEIEEKFEEEEIKSVEDSSEKEYTTAKGSSPLDTKLTIKE